LAFWRLVDSGVCDAAFNMALDEALSVSVRKANSPTVMRLYAWEAPAISIGAFQKASDINLEYCTNNNIQIVRRPTGGRAILHGDELTYSFSAKNDDQFAGGLMNAYRRIGEAFNLCFSMAGLKCLVRSTPEKGSNLSRSPLCFASSSLGEISSNGMKIIGSAQKRWKDGFLQQGTIPFATDHTILKAVFRKCFTKFESSAQSGLRELLPHFDVGNFKKLLITAFEETFAVTLVDSQPSSAELELAHQLAAEKYLEQIWTLEGKTDDQFCNNAKISQQV